MNEQGSYDGFSPASYGAAPPAAAEAQVIPAAPALALRPLSTGEVLDRTFALYRRRFWLFAGISLLPAALLTLSALVRMIFLTTTHAAPTGPAGASPDALAKAMSDAVLLQAYFLPATILFVIAYGISHAATVHAVTQISSGLATSAGSSYRAVRGRWLRWVGIAMRQFWAALWPIAPAVALFVASVVAIRRAQATSVAAAGLFILLAGLFFTAGGVLGVINFLRVALAMPAGVQEQLGVNAAMRRSRALVAGRKGRIFLALLLVYALQIVAGAIQAPLLLLAVRMHGSQQILVEAIELLVQFAATTLVSPIAPIALCLFYIDERVRREGYDIELLMQRSYAASDLSATAPKAQPLA